MIRASMPGSASAGLGHGDDLLRLEAEVSGVHVNEVSGLKALEKENRLLKRLLATQALNSRC
jgi:hypothetical protein